MSQKLGGEGRGQARTKLRAAVSEWHIAIRAVLGQGRARRFALVILGGVRFLALFTTQIAGAQGLFQRARALERVLRPRL